MNRKKALAINSIASLLQQIVAVICGLVVPRLILKTYGSSANGTIASVSQFISVTSLLQGGITSAARVAFYHPVSVKDQYETSVVYKTTQKYFQRFAFVLATYILLLAVIYPVAVSTPFHYWDVVLLVIVLGIGTIFEYLFGMANQLLLFADQKGYINTYLQIGCTLLSSILSVCLIERGKTLIVVKLVAAIVLIIRPIALYYYVKRRYTIDRSVSENRSALSQTNAALAKSVAYYVHTSTDTMVVTVFLNVTWVSVYAVHRYVVSSISNLVSSVLGNTEALFGQMIARNENDAIQKEVPLYDLFSKILSTIFFVPCLILISQFIDIYTAGVKDINYQQPLFAAILCLAEYVYCTSLTYNNMIMAAGHIKQTQWISITEALINIVSSIVLVKTIGVIGVAIGTLAAFVFNTIANLVYMRRHIFKMSLLWVIKSYASNALSGLFVMGIFMYMIPYRAQSYVMFFIYAFAVLSVTCVSVVLINYAFFGKSMKPLLIKLKNRVKR